MVTPAQAREIIHEWMFASKPALETGAKAIDALRDLASQVESLQADAERMDWIESQGDEFISGILQDGPAAGTCFVSGSWCTGEGKTFREAIDEARKQS